MDTITTMKKVKQQLHEAGFKLTPQREATLLVLLENEKDHLSAEEVFFFVKRKSPEIGLATVYRTLEILTELHVVDKVSFNDGVSRYDLRKEGAQHFHHHLLCIECGNIEEIEEDLLGDVEEIVENKYHFLVKDHRLTFHGICQNCQKNEVMPESHVGFGVAYFFLLQMVLIWYDDKDVTKEDMVKDARTNYRLFTLFND